MIFRQLFDSASSTYTYLLGCSESLDTVVIDPVFEQHARDAALIGELGLNIRYALDTHVHADHVTGVGRTDFQAGDVHEMRFTKVSIYSETRANAIRDVEVGWKPFFPLHL